MKEFSFEEIQVFLKDDVVVIYDLIKGIPDKFLKGFFCLIMQVIEDPELPIHETVSSI